MNKQPVRLRVTSSLNFSQKLTYISNYDKKATKSGKAVERQTNNPHPQLLEQSSFLEVAQTQKGFSAFFQNQKIYYSFHMSLSIAPILNQINPAHALTNYFPNPILISTTHVHQGLQTDPFPWGFPTKNVHVVLTSPIRDTFPA
jgi:hypothetical protein